MINYDKIFRRIDKKIKSAKESKSIICITSKKINRNIKKLIWSMELSLHVEEPELIYSEMLGLYDKDSDLIMNIPRTLFKRDMLYSYYYILLHEICHATGHKDRLNRDSLVDYTGENIHKEEIIADIGAFMLGNLLGLYINYDYIALSIKESTKYCTIDKIEDSVLDILDYFDMA